MITGRYLICRCKIKESLWQTCLYSTHVSSQTHWTRLQYMSFIPLSFTVWLFDVPSLFRFFFCHILTLFCWWRIFTVSSPSLSSLMPHTVPCVHLTSLYLIQSSLCLYSLNQWFSNCGMHPTPLGVHRATAGGACMTSGKICSKTKLNTG